jgi:hypothetical protein
MYHCHILEHEDAGMMGQYTCTGSAQEGFVYFGDDEVIERSL